MTKNHTVPHERRVLERSGRIRIAMATLLIAMLAAACGTLADSADDAQIETEDSTENGASPDQEGGTGSDEAAVETLETSPTSTTEAEPATMPDLVGLTETEARSALAQLGASEPTVAEKESFEQQGTVLEQIPSAGRVVSGGISLVVAVSIPPMPDFVGALIAEVRAWAEPRGVEIRIEEELTADVAGGNVLAQVPAPGAQVSQEIIVTVAATPAIIDLKNLTPVDQDRYSIGDIQMDGQLYGEVGWITTRSSPNHVSFNLSRDWITLEMTLGLSDEKSASAAVQVEFIADSQTVQTETLVFGVTNEIKLDVSDVLRLSIVVDQISGSGETSVGFGNARLIGSASSSG